MSLLEELKRRNVIRVGIAYVVSAWVVLQVADLVLENIDAPGWVMEVLMLVIALGFFAAVVIAWAYELTPDGIKREKDVVRGESVTHETARKLDLITLAAVAVVIVVFALDRFVLDKPPSRGPAATEATSVAPPADPLAEAETAERAAAAAADSGAADAAASGIGEMAQSLARGVAVLPFENLSVDEANAYFAGGIHEDVLTHLANIGELRVISRTSMLRIAERGLDIPEIGRQLGVSHVLEGSVRRAGDQVRVTVQLIDAASDEHLWAQNYDRRLDDIFAIQTDIARSIAAQLQTKLTAAEEQRIAERPTDNLAAYELYLKARELARTWRGAEGFQEQREPLEEAVRLDPEFLEAQVMLAEVYGRLVWTNADPDGIYAAQAREVTDAIERNWPDRPEALVARANYLYNIERDYEGALAGYEAALPQMPNDEDVLLAISSSNKRLFRPEEGLKAIRRAMALDPENRLMSEELIFQLWGSGHFDEAIARLERAFAEYPGEVSYLRQQANIELSARGDVDRYLELEAEAMRLDPGVAGDHRLQRIRLGLGTDVDELIATVDSLASSEERGPWDPLFRNIHIAQLLAVAGRDEEGAAAARRAMETAETNLAEGLSFPGQTHTVWYALLSYAACLADDEAAFNRYRAIADAMPVRESLMRYNVAAAMALAHAACGDPARGWSLLRLSTSGFNGVTAWDLALDPPWKHFFGELPEYQAAVAEVMGSE